MTIIQQKRGTADRWSTLDPVLAVGEIGYESDTGKFKIGDGQTVWSSLSYFSTSGGGGGSGTVTSVDITVPTGLVVSGNPITTTGTLAVAYDTGYSIPTDMSQGYWSTAYGWGDHSLAGYQPGDADLTAIAALTADGLLRKTSGTWGMDSATYLTSYTETDTLSSVTGRGATTNTAISITNNTSSTDTTTGALKVTGGVGIQENLNIGGNTILTGNLTVTGTTTLNSTTVVVADPILTIGGTSAPGSDDNKDRGIAFRWHNGSTAKIGFFGFDDSAQQFTFIPDATITSEVVSGSTGTLAANLNGNATTATSLASAVNIWGQSFDGSTAISGNLTSVGTITGTAGTTLAIAVPSVSTSTGTNISITGGATTYSAGIANAGDISITGGSSTAGTSDSSGGNITITGGATNTSAGFGGNVTINGGLGSGPLSNGHGNIYIGTSNTDSITIGNSNSTTTFVGTLSGAFVTSVSASSPVSSTGGTTPQISLSSGYGDTQNPYGTKSQYYVLAGPTTPTPATPSFRLLVANDIPDLSGTYLTTSATATNSTNINISTTTGNTSDTTLYPVFVGASSTGAQLPHIDSSGIVYNASTDSLSLTGDLTVTGGDVVLGGTGTATTIKTLAATATSSGSLTISTGDTTTSGASGNISIDVGNGASSEGTISIGTGNASAITIGKSGTTTTIAGTLSISTGYGDTTNPYGAKPATYVLAGPTTGSPNAAPTFRALVSTDIPSLSATYLALAGGTMTGAATLRAGGTTAGTAPIYFSSSTSLLSTVAAGAMEFNNKALYFTPDVTPGRGLVPTRFYKIIATDNTSLINVSPGVPTTYSAFGTNGIALDTGVAYEVEMLLLLSASAASNSSTLIITPGSPTGAAVPSSSQLYYDYSASTTAMTNAAATSAVLRTGTTSFPSLNTITISTGTTQYVKAFMKGIVNIATGGNFTIRLAFTPTSPGTVTGTIYAGSYLKITPLGSEGVTEVGTWA